MNYIHWYPGHIAKAERQFKEKLGQTDLVLEILDARIPYSSRYQNSNKLTGCKLKIVLLNKSDISDPDKNKVWVKKLTKDYGCPVILTTAKNQKDTKIIVKTVLKTAYPVFEKLKSKGLMPRPIRIMVIGMPNVGKSSMINKLSGRAKAKTGAKAGLTRSWQWVRLHEKIELLDTPGIIPAALDNQEAAAKLSMVNSISENAYDNETIASGLLKILDANYPNLIREYYDVEGELTLEAVARARNWIMKGKAPDIVRASQFILTNFRDGKIGKITLDEPEAV